MRKGCEAFLAYVKDTQKIGKELKDIPIVRDYPDVFPEKLPGLPPRREVQVIIKVLLGTALISQAPYKTTPIELVELKVQLQELLEKKFI